ncbi:acetyl-CoA C-acetyltransferase [Sporolactobacillus sp. THM19-2]|uniref:acetyl-CoA C-acetyltransferase n=1 Tax=Sporolactobacillus sp. THM19-2 TaxID=2511171 RepID=UPI001F0F1D08|nr:acetyl-CoA C-acetyltransferase [Sporolactobacillus sp. THM19-2]
MITSAVRTPIGDFGGSLREVSAVDLGAITVKEAIQRAHLTPREINQVIFGNVLQSGLGQNPARQIAVKAGIPFEAPAMTINEVCGSGLKSVILGYQQIQLGEADSVVAGGTENMSQAPYLLPSQRWGKKFGNISLIDSMLQDGLTDAFGNIHMGITAENVANHFGISRLEQDRFALKSQEKASKARKSGKFQDEIIPVHIKNSRGEETVFKEDEHIRDGLSLDDLLKLRPAFVKDGTVTAGNESGINDCASALVLMKKSDAEARNIPYFAVIKGYTEIGTDPSLMGFAPYYALKKLVKKTDIPLDKIDLFELNEAFASQSLAVIRELGLDVDKINVNGGAIALGHPIGASGARILVTLLHEMKRRGHRYGVASLCVGGGIGISLLVECGNDLQSHS